MKLNNELFVAVSERFRALGEPARLRILDALRQGEQTVGELVGRTGLSQANLSKHLQVLHAQGFVARWKSGLFVHYRLADDDIFKLCDIMCGRIARTPQPLTRKPPRTARGRPSRRTTHRRSPL